MYFIYVIKNEYNGKLYIGYTSDLNRRFKEHIQNFKKDKIIYYEAYLRESDARAREKKLKYYGSAWRALRKRINA
ncbi:MAG: GIY-YIG nuclease family protein [Candidatus Liptonbacteria bacterium]|nr:GIY-YIG nuclease family protein [Candidatus Liptonbacteria bacterium]